GRLAEGADGDDDGGRGGTGHGGGHRGVNSVTPRPESSRGALSQALPSKSRVAASLGCHSSVLALGLWTAFHPTLASGFARLQSDPGDTLLNHYILEHSWRWLTRSDYIGTL